MPRAPLLPQVGVDADALCVEGSSLAHWGPRELHRLVAHFLRARFPLLLALNKADLGAAGGNIRWGCGGSWAAGF